MWLKWTLLLFFIYLVHCDDGLCGLEPPKEGESCSGSTEDTEENGKDTVLKYEYEEKPMTAEEEDIWAKRFYTKMRYTNKVDWPIREELDHAENYFANDLDKAVELFEDLQKKHPNSPRALYVGTRARLSRLFNSTLKRDTEEYNKELNAILDVYSAMLDRYVEDSEKEPEDMDIMPVLFSSIVVHSTSIADAHNLTERSVALTKKAMDKSPGYQNEERYHLAIIHGHILLGQWELAEKATDLALELKENSFNLQMLKGLLMKTMGRKKEGNRLLRSLDSDRVERISTCHDTNNFAQALFNFGKYDFARMLIQESSKHHIFLSHYQRPVLTIEKDNMENEVVWDHENHVGLSTYDEEFEALKEVIPVIKAEALKAVENEAEQQRFYVRFYENANGNIFESRSEGGNLTVLPLFVYGKRERMNCMELMPQTCKFLKANFTRPTQFKLGVIKLNAIDAKTKTLPLDSLTNANLRLILPLQVPQGFEYRVGKDTILDLKEDQIMVIDQSYEHSYNNQKGSQKAVWLSIDLIHPDLTEQDLKQVQASDYAKQLFLQF